MTIHTMWSISKCLNYFLRPNPTTLILNFLVSAFWQRIQIWHFDWWWWRWGGGWGGHGGAVQPGKYIYMLKSIFWRRVGVFGRTLKPEQYACQTIKRGEIQHGKQVPQCWACGTINISNYKNNFLMTNPITVILSSLVRKIWQRI